MNVWKLTAPEKLIKEDEAIPTPQEGELKVRVTDVLLNSVDGFIYDGTLKAPYPLVLGRFAIGRVSSEDASLPKGTRVFLHTFPQEKDTGTAKIDFSQDATLIRGQTTHGFLRDFLLLDESDLTVIPESVPDELALLTELVALAKATVDALDVRKGMHIAVIGGDMLGLIICRLLIYQQVSPILIDNHTNRLQFAKQNGVYYTSFADDSLMDNVAKITGGRLADGAIFVTSSGPKDKALPFKVSARETHTVFCGFHGHDVSVNLDVALKKQITVYGITDGSDYISTAFNLIATKAIDFSSFTVRRRGASELDQLFQELADHPADSDVNTLNIVQLI